MTAYYVAAAMRGQYVGLLQYVNSSDKRKLLQIKDFLMQSRHHAVFRRAKYCDGRSFNNRPIEQTASSCNDGVLAPQGGGERGEIGADRCHNIKHTRMWCK